MSITENENSFFLSSDLLLAFVRSAILNTWPQSFFARGVQNRTVGWAVELYKTEQSVGLSLTKYNASGAVRNHSPDTHPVGAFRSVLRNISMSATVVARG